MSLSLARSLLWISVHPLESAARGSALLLSAGSGAVRDTVDLLSAVSSHSLQVAALAPALLDVLRTAQAERLCAALMAAVKGAQGLLQSEHAAELLSHGLGLLRSPDAGELVDALTSVALTSVRLCRTPQVGKASAQLARAISTLHAQIASSASAQSLSSAPPSCDAVHAAWVDCVLHLDRMRRVERALSGTDVERAFGLARTRNARLMLWWSRTASSTQERAATVEGRAYNLDGEREDSGDEGRAEGAPRTGAAALRELHALLHSVAEKEAEPLCNAR